MRLNLRKTHKHHNREEKEDKKSTELGKAKQT